MRWQTSSSQFDFHIAHIANKKNQVVDTLCWRPKVNAVSIASHRNISSMINEYVTNLYFKDMMSALELGKKKEPYKIKNVFLLYGYRLWITQRLRKKVMHEPMYESNRGIQATLKGAKIYFYWPYMKLHIQEHVSTCVVCQ